MLAFFRICEIEQSNIENRVPHIAKLPPRIGALLFTLETAWTNICPLGAFLRPPNPCHTLPPTKPIQKKKT
jgi:hypothetical protein